MNEIIATILVVSGVSTDNFIVAGWFGKISKYFKSYKSKLILFLVFTIHIQIFSYGSWLANFLSWKNHSATKWLSLFLLFTIDIRMLQELKVNMDSKKILISLKDFVAIILASGIYFFFLGFAINILSTIENITFYIFTPVLILSMMIGWLIGKTSPPSTFRISRIIGILILFIGSLLFTIKTII